MARGLKQKESNEEQKTIKPIVAKSKEIARKKAREIKQDVFALIWILFAAVLLAMSVYFKDFIKEMMVISVLFLVFWYLEDIMFGMTGTTVTTVISRGKKIEAWKRFPLFFLAVVLIDVVWNVMWYLLDLAFPGEQVNIVFIGMWLGLLFLLWVYKFSKEKEFNV